MRIRIYYNRDQADGLIWSYDHGTQETEVNVSAWHVHGLSTESGRDMTVVPGDQERPRVWVNIFGVERVDVRGGIAHFYGSDSF